MVDAGAVETTKPLEIFRSMFTLRAREIYFSPRSNLVKRGEDFRIFIQSTCKLPNSQKFFTSIISLTPEIEELATLVKKGTMAEVRRAASKDGVSVHIFDSPVAENIRSVVAFYNAFARSRKLRDANETKMLALAARGALVMSVVRLESNPAIWLAAHVYIVDGDRARLLYSASCDLSQAEVNRQLVGRANKYLHWQMIQHFKKLEYRMYDFGGISKSAELRTIDEFKESFGGAEFGEFNGMVGITWRGKSFVWMYRRYVQGMRLARTSISRLRA